MKTKSSPFGNVQVLSAIIFLLLASLGYKVVIPKISSTLTIYNQLNVLKSRLDTLNSKVSDLNGLNNYELESRNSDVVKALPSDKNTVGRMSFLGYLAGQNGILVENMRLTPGSLSASGSATLGVISIDLSLSGNSDQIISFLQAIQTHLPIFNMKALSTNLVKGGATIKLETYFMGYPKTIGKIDVAVPKLTDSEEELLGNLRNYKTVQLMEYVEGAGGKENPFLGD